MTSRGTLFTGIACTTAVTTILAVSMLAQTPPASQPSAAEAPRRGPITPHAYPLDDASYLRWALPTGQEAYADIDGTRLKGWVNEITGISRQSQTDGERYWGRISGNQDDYMAEMYVEDKFKQFGLQDIRRQWFDLPPQWFPTTWSVSASGGGKSLTLETARPAARTTATPASGLDVDAVWVGLGTEADFLGRDVKGKAVVLYSIPTPSVIQHSAVWNGALRRAGERGAAAVIVSIAIPGNFQNQLNNTASVPTFSISSDDLTSLRELMEKQTVKVKMNLAVEMKSGLRDANVWGVLPGATDEDIVIMAHHDAYFEGALDNASGISVMLALAEHFSKIPQAQRRRTLKFVTTSGHHNGSLGTLWMHDNAKTFLTKTALLLNCEHVSVTQTLLLGEQLQEVEPDRRTPLVGLRQRQAGRGRAAARTRRSASRCTTRWNRMRAVTWDTCRRTRRRCR